MGLVPEDRRHDRREVEVAGSRCGRLVQPGPGGARQLQVPTARAQITQLGAGRQDG